MALALAPSFAGAEEGAGTGGDPVLVSLELDPTSVEEGGVSQGTVTLSEPAPPGGTTITLSVDSPSAIVPASVTLPAGASSSLFDVTAVGPPTVVTVSATLNLVTVTAQLDIGAPGAPFGNSLKLDGTNDYANVADAASLDLGDAEGEDFTIETSFYVPDETSEAVQVLFFKQNAYRLSINFNTSTADVLIFGVWALPIGSGDQLLVSNSVSAGWHHIAAVFDNEHSALNDRLSIFFDGALVADNAAAVDYTPGINNASNLLSVGANSGAAAYQGWLDDARFSDTVRYTAPFIAPTAPFGVDANTRALWHFDDAACATSFTDSSGNGNTLMAQNGALAGLFGASAPTLQYSSSSYSVGEGLGSATITVTRDGDPLPTLGVNHTTSDGTAEAPADYTDSDGTLSLGCGDMEETFSVPTTFDSDVEGNETVALALDTPTGGASLGSPSTATLTVVDRETDPPETTIDAGTNGPTRDRTPEWNFSSDEAGSTFECRLLPAAFTACTSPHETAVLVDGPYTFEVRAKDAAGNVDATPASRSVTVDTIAPETQLDTVPGPVTNDNTATFTFSSNEAITMTCRMGTTDPFTACSQAFGHTTPPLSDGSHTFQARATDLAGNVDPSPASYTFTVDTDPPEVTIDSGPDGPTNDSTPTFTFSADEPVPLRLCRVDSSPFDSCDGPTSDTSGVLTDGSHTFHVSVFDAAGNSDSASRSFTVDTDAPETTIDSGPSGPTNDTTPTFEFSADEDGAEFECSLDGVSFSGCSSPHTLAALIDGEYTLYVQATDEAGNTSPAATQDFAVDTSPPQPSFDFPSDSDAYNAVDFESGCGDQSAPDACGQISGDSGPVDVDVQLQRASDGMYWNDTDWQLAPIWLPAVIEFDTSWSLQFPQLTDGSYTASVRASDQVGNVSDPPSSVTFLFDDTAPDTTIDSGPTGTTGDSTPTFTFSSDEGGNANFDCKVDEGPFQPCPGGNTHTTDPLADGPHTFQVRAEDLADNQDPTPASRSFTVDTSPPPPPPPPPPPGPAGPPPGIDGANTKVREGRKPKWLNITIRLSQAAAQPVQIQFLTKNGSAKAGKDYRKASGALTVPAGQTSIVLRIRILADRKKEKREQFSVALTGPTNVDTARVTILDRR